MTNIVVHAKAGNVVTTGLSLMVFANRYRRAAESLYRAQSKLVSFDPVIYFLYCQSLELHLKSFVWLKEGVSRDTLRNKYRHNLLKLWNRAKSKGVSRYVTVTDLRDDVISLVSPYYKTRQFNYLDLEMVVRGFNDLRAEPRAVSTLHRLTGRFETTLRQPILRAS